MAAALKYLILNYK